LFVLTKARELGSTCLRIARRVSLVGLVLLSVAAPREVLAEDVATKSAARKLGEEGIALFDKGQYGEALEKFNLADQLVPAPTLGLRAARCLVKLGRLVEASERYLEVTRMDLSRIQITPAFRKAQAEALKEREELLPLIPNLTVEVTGPIGDGITVYIDGEQIPAALLGQKRPIDPGKHDIEVKRGEAKVKKSVDLMVKQQEKVVLELPALPKPKPPEPNGTLRALAWVGIGVGAGGFIAFGVNGALLLSKQNDLIGKCGTDRTCPAEFQSDVDTFDLLQVGTTAGLVAGVVGLSVGIPLYFASNPKIKEEKKDASVLTWMPYVGPGSVGVKGTF